MRSRSLTLAHPATAAGSSAAVPAARPLPAAYYQFSPFHELRQTSPFSAYHSVGSSPITPIYGSQRSPSWILGNRDSPYRPVRGVNTLLVPPPHPYHLDAPQQVTFDQMHYQPLAKARKTECKTGVVPYLHPEVEWSPHPAWSEQHIYGI